jgi:hypothetical protein
MERINWKILIIFVDRKKFYFEQLSEIYLIN